VSDTAGIGYLVSIDSEIRQRARELLYPGGGADTAYLGKEAEVAGAFGEAAFERMMQRYGDKDLRHVGIVDHDFEHRVLGSLEVKTKPRSVRPRASYEASIAVANLSYQEPDRYVFVSLYPKAAGPYYRYEQAWIVGWEHREEYLRKAYLVPKGSEMGGGRQSFRDMLNLEIADLQPIEDLVREGFGMINRP
jgi:hypothetical protein